MKSEREIVEKIRQRYVTPQSKLTKFEELKLLDKKVKTKPRVIAYVFGSLSTLVLGTGMCLAMKIVGNLMPLGIVVGLLGIVGVITAYPIYKSLLARQKTKYSAEIIAKSDELLNKEKGE